MLPPLQNFATKFQLVKAQNLDKSLENFVVPGVSVSLPRQSVANLWKIGGNMLLWSSTNQWIFCKIYLVKIFSWVPKLGKLLPKVKVSAKQCKSQVQLWQISALSDRPSELTKMLHGINLIISNSNSMNFITCFNLESTIAFIHLW